MSLLGNRAQMSVSGTPGTGTVTLGAATTGYQAFGAAGVADGDLVSYLLTDGAAWEVGYGTYTASGTTLARTTIRESTNAGAAISASSSTVVTLVALAEHQTQVGFALSMPGKYQVPQHFASTSVSQIATANTAYIAPLWSGRRQQITRIGHRIVTGATSTNIRVALYSDHPTLAKPFRLLADGGNISSASTGDKEATVAVWIDPGVYWLVVTSDGAPTLGAGSIGAIALGGNSSSINIRGFTAPFTFGAYPADASGWTLTDYTSANMPTCWMRNV